MLLSRPLDISIYFIVDEFLNENLVIVRRARPQHWGLEGLHWRSRRGPVLHHLQVNPLPVAIPLDVVQLGLYLAEAVLYCLPTFINASFNAVCNFPKNIWKAAGLFFCF